MGKSNTAEAVDELDETTVSDPNNPEVPEDEEALDSEAALWNDLSREEDEDVPEEPVGKAESEDEEREEEVAESEPQPEPQPEPVPEPEPQPPAQPVAEQPVQPQPSQPVLTPEQQEWLRQQQLAQQQTLRSAQRQQAIDNLAQSYKLEAADAEAFDVNPSEVLPKLAARLHVAVLEQVMPLVAQMIPQQVQQVQTESNSAREVKDSFFRDYPELKEHEAQVTQFAMVWRQMNPDVPLDKAKKAIGDHMRIALGLHNPAAAPPPSQQPPPPPAGRQPRSGNEKPRKQSAWDSFVEEVMADDD